jgi:hypothetical protein
VLCIQPKTRGGLGSKCDWREKESLGHCESRVVGFSETEVAESLADEVDLLTIKGAGEPD